MGSYTRDGLYIDYFTYKYQITFTCTHQPWLCRTILSLQLQDLSTVASRFTSCYLQIACYHDIICGNKATRMNIASQQYSQFVHKQTQWHYILPYSFSPMVPHTFHKPLSDDKDKRTTLKNQQLAIFYEILSLFLHGKRNNQTWSIFPQFTCHMLFSKTHCELPTSAFITKFVWKAFPFKKELFKWTLPDGT